MAQYVLICGCLVMHHVFNGSVFTAFCIEGWEAQLLYFPDPHPQTGGMEIKGESYLEVQSHHKQGIESPIAFTILLVLYVAVESATKSQLTSGCYGKRHSEVCHCLPPHK